MYKHHAEEFIVVVDVVVMPIDSNTDIFGRRGRLFKFDKTKRGRKATIICNSRGHFL